MALQHMNSTEFEAARDAGGVVLVYFWTDWHDTCKEATPILEEVAKKYEGEALVCALNADQEGFLALELGAYTIPTVLLYDDGVEIDRIGGVQSAALYGGLLDARLHPEDLSPFELISSMGYS